MSSLRPTVDASALLDGRDDSRFRQMLYDLMHLEAFMRRVRERLGAELGITGASYSVLMKIAEAGTPEGIRVVEVAERLHVSGAFVTRETNKLVTRGLVAKSPDPADGRSIRLMLTDESRGRLQALGPKLRQVNGRLFGHMSREEFATFASLTAQISYEADQMTNDGLQSIVKMATAA